MKKWKNDSGKQLSSEQWLLIHHTAKLKERKEFIKKNIANTDKVIIDIGCGPGLWMNLIDEFLTNDCTLIGVDSDNKAISAAKERLKISNACVEFINCNVEEYVANLPNADLILLFNMFCYIENPDNFINKLKEKLNYGGRIIIRQYDGSNIRIGPMEEKTRKLIDNSLFSSLSLSKQFHHYDLDRVFEAIENATFTNKKLEMEIFFKKTPYTKEVRQYLIEHIKWTSEYISEIAKLKLNEWLINQFDKLSYCTEVDLVAILS